MKSKLLLSLGVVAILGMAQTVEASSDIDVARSILARLSPEQRTALFAEYVPQETAVPVVREESYTQPEWIEEQFGTGNRAEDVKSIYVRNGIMMEVQFSAGRFGELDIRCNPDRLCDLLKAVAGGVFKNIESLHLDFGTPVAEAIQTLIDCISGGKFLNMRRLGINTGSLNMNEKMRLEQALLNSHSSSLEELYVYGWGSFEFAKKMCDKKKSKFPKLSWIRLMSTPLDERFTELRRSILREAGVLIQGRSYGTPETEDEEAQTRLDYKLYQEWKRMHGQED